MMTVLPSTVKVEAATTSRAPVGAQALKAGEVIPLTVIAAPSLRSDASVELAGMPVYTKTVLPPVVNTNPLTTPPAWAAQAIASPRIALISRPSAPFPFLMCGTS